MKQTVIAYLKDEPGVLNQISRLFYRLNYNIESIAAGNSEVRGGKKLKLIEGTNQYGLEYAVLFGQRPQQQLLDQWLIAVIPAYRAPDNFAGFSVTCWIKASQRLDNRL